MYKVGSKKNYVHTCSRFGVLSLSEKGPGEVLHFLDVLQPLFTKFLLLKSFSENLKDFNVSKTMLEETRIFLEIYHTYTLHIRVSKLFISEYVITT
jgi:hypothetical protein